MLNEYQFKRKLSWVYEIVQLILLTVCIYSSFVAMPYLLAYLEQWRPQLEQPFAVRVVAANTTRAAEMQKQEIAEKVINTVEKQLTSDLSTKKIQEIVYNGLQRVDELKEIDYKWRINEQIIPPKLINGVIYPQQIHKAVLVEIREAKGDNFFCAVFPNVCIREDKQRKEKIKFKWFEKVFRKK